MEAAGQSGGPRSHGGRDAGLTGGRRGTRGEYQGQQSTARATQSPGGTPVPLSSALSPCLFLSFLKCTINR